MPFIPVGKSTNRIQPNASSLEQNRRNWQRLAKGGVSGLINVAAPIINSGGTLGLSFDSSVFSVSGGSLHFSLLTTKGDLATFSTTPVRLPVGADGTVLTADSTQPDGIAWEAGGGSQTIQQVLTTGNDAGGLTLTDLGELDVGVLTGTYFKLFLAGSGTAPEIDFGTGGSRKGVFGYDPGVGRLILYDDTGAMGVMLSDSGFAGIGSDAGSGTTNTVRVYHTGQVIMDTAKLTLPSLPTSSAGLSTGDVWSNGGVLNIV